MLCCCFIVIVAADRQLLCEAHHPRRGCVHRSRRPVLLAILNALAPVLFVIALGWGLTRTGFLSERSLRELNRVTYWVGLPSLLVQRIASADPQFGAVTGLLVVAIGATVGGILVAYTTARVMGLPASATGAFVQGAFRGNLAFIGLPVVIYAFEAADGASVAAAQSSALLLFGPLVVLYNIAAVAVLLAGRGGTAGMIRGLVYGLVTNPILIACALGLALALAGVRLPVMLDRSLAAVGQMALPLALVCIGGTLCTSRVRGRVRWALAGAVLKVAALPVMGALLAWALGLSPEHTRIALIMLACPAASASYVLARQLGGDEALASSLILLSSLLAVPAMIVVLAFT